MKPIRWAEAAWDEAFEASEYYEARRTDGGSAFTGRLWDAIQLIRTHPEAGTPFGLPIRRVLLHGYPYSIIYVPEPDEIYIVAVAHQRREPRYWEGRL